MFQTNECYKAAKMCKILSTLKQTLFEQSNV